MMPNQPFMGPRGYPGPGPGPRGPGVRMPQGMGNDFNGPPQPLMPNNMDPSRQGESMKADFFLLRDDYHASRLDHYRLIDIWSNKDYF